MVWAEYKEKYYGQKVDIFTPDGFLLASAVRPVEHGRTWMTLELILPGGTKLSVPKDSDYSLVNDGI